MNTTTTTTALINLDARQAAEALNISERTLWTKTKAGDVPHVKIGTRTLYPAALLEQWAIDQAKAHAQAMAAAAAAKAAKAEASATKPTE